VLSLPVYLSNFNEFSIMNSRRPQWLVHVFGLSFDQPDPRSEKSDKLHAASASAEWSSERRSSS